MMVEVVQFPLRARFEIVDPIGRADPAGEICWRTSSTKISADVPGAADAALSRLKIIVYRYARERCAGNIFRRKTMHDQQRFFQRSA
jgi:hypothetical protein